MQDHDVLASFTVNSMEGNERLAIAQVAQTVGPLGLDLPRLEKLKTAVGEAVMNAIEHGNEYNPELDVFVQVEATPDVIRVAVTDYGGETELPATVSPDLEAKLAGDQNPRGWGLFLIDQMVDEVVSTHDGPFHTVELIVNRNGEVS